MHRVEGDELADDTQNRVSLFVERLGLVLSRMGDGCVRTRGQARPGYRWAMDDDGPARYSGLAAVGRPDANCLSFRHAISN